MRVTRFIASGLARGDGSLSRTSNTIAWVSVALSIAIMIVALAVVAGFKAEIRDRATGFMGSVMLVQPGQSPLNELYPFSEQLSYREALAAAPGVAGVSGVAWRSGLIKTDDNIGGLSFKGVDSLYDFSFFANCLVDGALPDYHGRISNDILISRTTANSLGFETGDDVVVYFIGEEVKVRKFRLCGIYDAGLEEIDSKMAVADRRQIQRLNGWQPDEVSSVEIRLAPGTPIEAATDRIENLIFAQMQDGDRALFVTNVKKLYGHLFDWLALLDLNVLMILLLMIAVAGFNMHALGQRPGPRHLPHPALHAHPQARPGQLLREFRPDQASVTANHPPEHHRGGAADAPHLALHPLHRPGLARQDDADGISPKKKITFRPPGTRRPSPRRP